MKRWTMAALAAIVLVVPAFADLPKVALAVPFAGELNHMSSNYKYLSCPVRAGGFDSPKIWTTANTDLEARYGKPTQNKYKSLLAQHLAYNYKVKDGTYLHVIQDTVAKDSGQEIASIRVCQDESPLCKFEASTLDRLNYNPREGYPYIEPIGMFDNLCQSSSLAAVLRFRGLDVKQEEIAHIIGKVKQNNEVHATRDGGSYDMGKLAKYGIKLTHMPLTEANILKASKGNKEPFIVGIRMSTPAAHGFAVAGYDKKEKAIIGIDGRLFKLTDPVIANDSCIWEVTSPRKGKPQYGPPSAKVAKTLIRSY